MRSIGLGRIVGLKWYVRSWLVMLLITATALVSLGQNNAPFIDNISDANIDEDVGLQTVNLSGIDDGDGGTQTITVTATSNNQTLIPDANIIITYTSPNATGTLDYTAVTDGFGTATITVTVMDDGGTSPGVDTYQVNFDVVVNPINDAPTFTKGGDIPVTGNLLEDAGTQNIFNWATSINAGGTLNNEAGQTLTFVLSVVGTTGNITFDALNINSFGTLTFKSTEHTNGVATIDVYLQDNGPSAPPPNQNTSVIETFTITVDAVNDPPSFTGGGNVTIDEGSPAQLFAGWATAISKGGGSDELTQNLTFVLTTQSLTGTMSFIVDPFIDPVTGDLSFEADLQANGVATYLLTLEDDGPGTPPDQNVSAPITLAITITAINDPPSFSMPQQLDTLEDAGLVSIVNFAFDLSPGSPDEVTQSLTFETTIIGTTNGLTFSENPRISSSGTLTFESSVDAFGTASVRVVLKDDGSSIPPNNNTSVADTLTLNILPLNDAPSFVKGEDPIIDEDAGAVTFPGWATNISPGAPNESDQVLTFQLTSTGTIGIIAFDSGPSISAAGDLTFEVGQDLNGIEFFEIVLMDDGPADDKNFNTSPIQVIKIEVLAINDPPTFLVGPDLVINENQGLTTLEGWATGITPGGGSDELDQKLTFVIEFVQFTSNLVFVIGPLVGETGDISYQSAPNTWGVGDFIIYLMDDGAEDPPNNNTSDPQTFKITVEEVNDPPTDILLSNNKVVETTPMGTPVGTFTAIDPDDTSHTFELVEGTGSGDNIAFVIDGNTLVTDTTFNFREKDLYNIRVSASDALSSVESVFIIEINPEAVSTVDFPSAFTPNDDGENDIWSIERIEYFPTAAVNIYTKNGQRVFSSVGYLEPWDGTWDGNEMPEDTYYVVIDLKNETPVIQSTITILR